MGKGRKKAEQLRDRKREAALYLKGYDQTEIAEELGITQGTVSRDLKALQEEWRKSTLVDVHEARTDVLAKIAVLYHTYWQGYKESKEEKVTTFQEKTTARGANKKDPQKPIISDEKSKAAAKKEQRIGDPRFLAGVQWCIEQWIKIYGIGAAESTDMDFKRELIEKMRSLSTVELRKLAALTDA